MNGYLLFALVGGLLALYFWLAVRMSALAQPLRFELADLGEELIADERVPQRDKRAVDFLLCSLFSRRVAWSLVIYFPLIGFLRTAQDRAQEEADDRLPVEVKAKIARAVRLATFSILSTSPIAFAIFTLEVLVALMVVAPTGRLIMRAMSRVLDERMASHHGSKLAH